MHCGVKLRAASGPSIAYCMTWATPLGMGRKEAPYVYVLCITANNYVYVLCITANNEDSMSEVGVLGYRKGGEIDRILRGRWRWSETSAGGHARGISRRSNLLYNHL